MAPSQPLKKQPEAFKEDPSAGIWLLPIFLQQQSLQAQRCGNCFTLLGKGRLGLFPSRADRTLTVSLFLLLSQLAQVQQGWYKARLCKGKSSLQLKAFVLSWGKTASFPLAWLQPNVGCYVCSHGWLELSTVASGSPWGLIKILNECPLNRC